MTFDEANARITEQLVGRTVDHVLRKGLEIEIVCTDGHVVVLAATKDYHIVHKRTDVRIVLPSVPVFSDVGLFI